MRADKRLTNRLAVPRLRFADARIENIDFAAHRGLDRRNTLSLVQGAWLKARKQGEDGHGGGRDCLKVGINQATHCNEKMK